MSRKRFKIMAISADDSPKAFFVYGETKKEAKENFIRQYPDMKLRIIGVHST